MSNPQTYYVSYNPFTNEYLDLSNIFQPYLGGTKTSTTSFTVNGYGDLNNIFDPSNGSINSYGTSYLVNGIDLTYYFAAKNPSIYTVSNTNQVNITSINYGGYTGLIFDTTIAPHVPGSGTTTNATCSIKFNTNKIIIS